MTDDELARALEAVLLVAIEPVTLSALCEVTDQRGDRVGEALSMIRDRLVREGRGFLLVEIASGWRFQTSPEAQESVQRFASRDLSSRLSTAALETLAIVAYRQPVSRGQMATLRGVNVDGVVRLLEQRGYIEPTGRADGPGQAILYGTTELFLDRLGLRSLDELPRPASLLPGADEAGRLADDLAPTAQ